MMNLFTVCPRSSGQRFPDLVQASPSAISTDRLSPRQIRLWSAIRKIALTQDPHGRPLYPTLYGLWCAVEQGGLPVFIELITDKKRCANQAGECAVEALDSAARMHSIRLRLFIPTIDRAYAGVLPAQEGMIFVPFSGLSREERYAKVLEHELAYIDRADRDPGYQRLLQDICNEQLAIAAGVGADGKRLSDLILKERWARIWPLVLESEKPAIAAEAEIYRELLALKQKGPMSRLCAPCQSPERTIEGC
jgi:hypothetical protein